MDSNVSIVLILVLFSIFPQVNVQNVQMELNMINLLKHVYLQLLMLPQ
jgi:hypothetical protein